MPLPSLPPALLLLPLLLVQLWYWLRYFRPFVRRPPEAAADELGPDAEPVSVLVCAHNELDNLRELLPLLLAQDYPAGFEVILVDDRSRDDTQGFAQQLAQYYHGRFRLVTVTGTPAGLAPKKYALTLGIKTARHERLVFLDADCRPAGPEWLRLLQRGFAQRGGAEVVLGYSGFAARPGLLNLLVRFENLVTAAQYLGLAWARQPYMGVGRNLAYTRATFMGTKGFASHIRRLSGDDDLLVQDAVGQGARVAVVADPPAQTVSEPVATWRAWWRQKRRHLSAGTRYRPADRRRLGLFMGTNALFYLLLPVLLAVRLALPNVVSLALAWLAQTLLVWAVYVPLTRRLGQRLPAAALPLLHFLYLVIYCAWGLSVLLKRPLQWK